MSGSSVGGFGAAFDYDLFHATFPHAQGYLVDDAGPALQGDAIANSLREAWYQSWRFNKALEATCPECRDDLSQAMKHTAQRFPRTV